MTAKQALKILDVTVDAVDMLLSATPVGSVVHSVLGHLKDGLAGKVEPQVVLLHLESLMGSLAANDAAADAALISKFGGGK